MANGPHSTERSMRNVGAILVGSGILLMFAGVIIGFFVAPIGFIAVGLGAIDLLIARQFTETGRGSVIVPGADAEADPDAIAAQEPPSGVPGENPYARED